MSILRQRLKRVGTVFLTCILVHASASTLAFACSSDRVPGLIERNYSVVRFYAVLSSLCLLASVVLFFLRRRKGLWVVLVSLFFVGFHPVWVYGGGGGDCGMSMAEKARFTSVLVAIGVAHQLRSWLITRHDYRVCK